MMELDPCGSPQLSLHGAQIGQHNVQLNLTAHPGPAVRSDYLEQVRRIAPAVLRDRSRELDALVAFCTAPEGERYLWWRAEAWAGKTALMSWLVLNPPPGVQIVSFFITARLAGQSDRAAFLDVTLEQLLALLHEPMPALLTDATREAHWSGALNRAADACRRAGHRLILVIDGLDEDRGVTTGADAHSIAALLPARPIAGLRVVITGRPNPPIPNDVPDEHPLRTGGIARPLSASPHAKVIRQDAERELKRLLQGAAPERDLLGLLTASGGGLSDVDLAELAGRPSWEIGEHLAAVSGRTFTPRSARWRTETVVYVLAHEELQRHATRFLGAQALDAYRQLLHDWAEEYRRRHWPPDTPEYLLRGYFNLLQALDDQPRMIGCAVDGPRHDRMLDITGGDTAALMEIAVAQERIVQQPDPDLSVMTRLAVHRAGLVERNNRIPSRIAGLWARLGRPARAEALARSIPEPSRRTHALAAIARDIAEAGDTRQARPLIAHARADIRLISDPARRAEAMAAVARSAAIAGDGDEAEALMRDAEAAAGSVENANAQNRSLICVARATAALGDLDRAETIARSIRGWAERDEALAAVVKALAENGNLAHADALIRSIHSRQWQTQAHAAMARTLLAHGMPDRAAQSIGKAERAAESMRSPGVHAWTLTHVAVSQAAAGLHRRARQTASRAEALARVISKPSEQANILSAVARAMAVAGEVREAQRIARGIANPTYRAKILVAVASGLIMRGDRENAEAVTSEAETVARSIAGPAHEGGNFSALAQAVASVGRYAQAEAIARSIPLAARRERALTAVARAIAAGGEPNRATALADSITDVGQRRRALATIAKTHESQVRVGSPGEGDLDRAEAAAHATTCTLERDNALAAAARTAAASGDHARADRIVSAIANPSSQVWALCSIGHLDSAEALARTLPDRSRREQMLLAVAQKLANAGETGRAETIAHGVGARHARGLVSVVEVLAAKGRRDGAERIARRIDEEPLRSKAFCAIALAGARAGDVSAAEALARAIAYPKERARAVVAVAQAIAAAGDEDRAVALVQTLADPSQQAQALVALAGGAGTPMARRLVARALQIDTWQTSLPALTRVAPEAIAVLAESFA